MNLLDTTLRKKRAATIFEKVIQDADMPRCPFCRRPILIDEPAAIIRAHGMVAAVHERCRLEAERPSP